MIFRRLNLENGFMLRALKVICSQQCHRTSLGTTCSGLITFTPSSDPVNVLVRFICPLWCLADVNSGALLNKRRLGAEIKVQPPTVTFPLHAASESACVRFTHRLPRDIWDKFLAARLLTSLDTDTK